MSSGTGTVDLGQSGVPAEPERSGEPTGATRRSRAVDLLRRLGEANALVVTVCAIFAALVVGALLIDAEALYDPRLTNDRLLLGMKGTISEMEVASFRERAHAALLQKAQRGALVRRVAIGYVKGPY